MHFDNEFERARLIPFAIDLNSKPRYLSLYLWLLTSVRKPTSAAEDRYIYAHIRTRNKIRGSLGVLKSRTIQIGTLMWRSSSLYTQDSLQNYSAVAVLHNICVTNNDHKCRALVKICSLSPVMGRPTSPYE